MARGGGSFGGGGGFSGGGHMGGSFGGSHTSGGRSFGGRPTGSSMGGGSSRPSAPPMGGMRGGYYAPVRRTVYHGGGGGNLGGSKPNPPGRGGKNSGCLSTLIVIAVFILLLVLIFALMGNFSSGSADVPANTTERTPLNGQINYTDWYRDDIGWITEDAVMIEGLEYFCQKTGIQPYILMVPYDPSFWRGSNFYDETGQVYLEQIYQNTFSDEAHLIFAYFEAPSDSKEMMDGQFMYLIGDSALSIMDNEAIKIFWGYFNNYYNDLSYTIEEMIANSFADTAEHIMSKPTNGYDVANTFLIVGGIVLVAVCIVFVIMTAIKRRREKEEYTRQILETPLETFGTDTSELEKKYEDN